VYDWLVKMWIETPVACDKAPFRHLPGGTEENNEIIQPGSRPLGTNLIQDVRNIVYK
jgi:hypothetical protein